MTKSANDNMTTID